MAEIEFKGATYRLGQLNAMAQFHVARRLAPVLATLVDAKDESFITLMVQAVGNLSDEDSEFIIGKCLADCRKVVDGTATKVYVNGQMMFEDIGMAGMIRLTIETLRENLADFFIGLRSGSLLPDN